MSRSVIILSILFLLNYKAELYAQDLQLPTNQSMESFIKEMAFIIKEHSQYAIAHPKNLENILRHLKHTCHTLDPSTVIERPMPAPEIGLSKVIKIYLKREKIESTYILIASSTNKFIKLCNEHLYSSFREELLPLAKNIHAEFTLFYEKL